jgi:hypothetical protein
VLTGNLSPSKLCPGMNSSTQNKSLIRYLDYMVQMANDDLKINATYWIHTINITQADPFSANLTMNMSLNATDSFANIYATRTIIANIRFENLEDPLYMLNGSYTQRIKKITLMKKVNWNQDDLEHLWDKNEYRNTPLGISFFDRIRGNLDRNSSDGIESYIKYTHSSVTFDNNDSMVDHYYWRDFKFNCTNRPWFSSPFNDVIVNINETVIPIIDPAPGAPSFQLDDVHRVDFKISTDDTSYTCPS